MKTRVYIAFDYDDLDLKRGLIAESLEPGAAFSISDMSILEPVDRRWSAEAERRIRGCDCVIVLCGEQTHQAKGVFTELQIAQTLGKRYFLLAGTRQSRPTKPPNARLGDAIYTYRHATLAKLLAGEMLPSDAIRVP